jgi:subtilisin family serine protease
MLSKFAPAALALAAVAVAPSAARADIIVQRAAGATASEIRSDAGVQLVQRLPLTRTEVVKAAPGDQAAALAQLKADPDVVYAEPDGAMHALSTDSYFGLQWALSNDGNGPFGGVAGDDIHAPQAWTISRGAGQTVAVVDTGVDFSHEDLAGQLAAGGWDWVDGDDDPSDAHGHGTHVAGIVAAAGDNGVGISGVAPAAKVLPLRVLDSTGRGSSADIAAAFAYAGDHGVRIVNASLGGGYSRTVENAVAAHPDTLYVVAAGNSSANDDDPSQASYPCALPEANLVCVGASDESDLPADFSNYGATSVDLFAPGVDIVSSYFAAPDSYWLMDGTSMASPFVAGTAALALAANPHASTSQLRAALLETVDRRDALAGRSATGGRLNAAGAVAELAGATPQPQAPVATPTPEPPAAPVAPPVSATPTPPVATPVAPLPARPVAPQPVLRHLHLRGSLSTRHGRLRVTFTLSRSASVRFTVVRHGSHRASGSWTVRARGGANAYTLMRRLPTHRTLSAGTYTLRVGLASTASTARFKIHR